MRLAILSTPRSGNTWFRCLLAHSLGLEQSAVHNIEDLPSQLPERYVLQIHWMPTPDFLEFLKKNEFRVISICRHPLDVLISILQFAPKCLETARWLEGQDGDESLIFDSSPTSEAFLSYCLSNRAKALLSVSPAWWQRGDTTTIRYESLAQQTSVELERLFNALSVSPLHSIDETIATFTLENLKRDHQAHYWRGKAYNHMDFMTYSFASAIYRHHRSYFEILGYGLADKDSYLAPQKVLENWEAATNKSKLNLSESSKVESKVTQLLKKVFKM